MPLQATSGAASYDAFGGGVAAVPNYIEDVFSTYLYPSISGDNQIVNNIDLSGKGGLVWIKSRDRASNHYLIDTVRGSSVGNTKSLSSNTTTAQTSGPNLDWVQFNNNGFTAKAVAGGGELGTNTYYGNMASWTFRKQPKFFDVVTYTGDGNTTKDISHNLGSKPGWIILKKTSSTSNWATLANPTGNGSTQYYLRLNTTDSRVFTDSAAGNTSTLFRVTQYGDAVTGNSADNMNDSGATYVAYIFAHNAGGFGLTGTDNVISCGSFTTDATTGNATVNLGFEPQWILTKMADGLSEWTVYDNMRGMSLTNSYELFPNSSSSEVNYGSPDIFPSSTGFSISYVSGSGQYGKNKNIIYIAIRRGPMKVPTSGTSVFSPNATTGSTGTAITTNFPVDLYVWQNRDGTYSNVWQDRLRGIPNTDTTGLTLTSQSALAEQNGGYNGAYQPWNTGLRINSGASGANSIYWNFRRAPSFFDEVCYTGTGAATTVTHNLGVVPELIIAKVRNNASQNWPVYSAALGASKYVILDQAGAAGNDTAGRWGGTAPTSTVFSVGATNATNGSGLTYVAYLFATCPGVSKVGSYTGNGSTQTINCGFTGGARFVLIKATSTTGDWMVADSARGIVSGNDPYLELNNTNAEVTGEDWLDTDSTGFVVNEVSGSNANTNGVTYIYLAIA